MERDSESSHAASAIGFSRVAVRNVKDSAAILPVEVPHRFIDGILYEARVGLIPRIEYASAEQSQRRNESARFGASCDIPIESDSGDQSAVSMLVLGA